MYTSSAWAWVLTAVIGYLCGAVSGSITVSKIFYKEDIRQHGSGNAGTTNVLRTYGKSRAAMTLAIDFAKTFLGVGLGKLLIGEYAVAVAGIAVTIGHAFPVYYGFKGGKAAACSAACMICIDIRVFIVAALLFFGSLYVKRIASISTLLVAVTLPFNTWFFFRHDMANPVVRGYMILSVFICVFVVILHRGNIKRLREGTELGIKKERQ